MHKCTHPWTNTKLWKLLIFLQHLDKLWSAHSRFDKFWEHLLCTTLFRSPHKFSTGFRSGLWLDHFKTFIFFCWSHSFVDQDVCFGSCWNVKVLFIFSFLADVRMFYARIDWYWMYSWFLKKVSPEVRWCKHHSSPFAHVLCWFWY